jgi:hypothetical protein
MNFDQAKHSARAFRLAAQRCGEMHRLPGGPLERLAVPELVCAAFSAELALKALLVAAGKQIRGHNLKNLFDELDAETQKKIIAATSVPEQEFLVRLNAVATVFDDWRYIHEKPALSTSPVFLEALAHGIETVSNA